MSVLLQIKDIRKTYGAVTLLDGASAAFHKYQKIGIIGRNGAGKSTLCKIIIGQEEKDSGQVIRSQDLRLGYLEQHDPYREDETVMDFLVRYTGKEEWQCGEIAARFGLEYDRQQALIKSLAGGYRTRVKLAAMLLGDPNFLILDEPTNYLDLSTLILLETFLQDFNGGFLIVSHDREFLKRTCDHTLEIENGQASLYPGDIEEYFEFKEEQARQMSAYNRSVEKKREQLQEFVDRFRAKASTASRAKSKQKQMEKLKTIEIAHSTRSVRIHIPRIERKVGPALFIEDLDIGYPDKTVASGIDLEIQRGSRVAILGDNGQGKTTFLRTLAGSLPPKAGSFRWTAGMETSYYAQHVFITLHPEDDVFAHLQREAAERVTTQDILDMAGSFLFRGDDVKKKVSVLSGGERARLILAGILLSGKQVLLLDEPTNHLDFETVEALGSALHDYGGTLFFISHDRTFVNLIATTILEVKDGAVRRYPGSYEDYVYSLETAAHGGAMADGRDEPEKRPARRHEKREAEPSPAPGAGGSSSMTIPERKKMKSELGKIQKEIARLEIRIENLGRERDRIHKEMEDNPFHYSKQRSEKLAAVNRSLEDEEKNYLDALEKKEKLEKKLG